MIILGLHRQIKENLPSHIIFSFAQYISPRVAQVWDAIAPFRLVI
jgi:hypothetical protein